MAFRPPLAALIAPLLCFASSCFADNTDEEAAYLQAIQGRASRIVDKLELTDAAQAQRVTTTIANQYRDLRDLHALRDQMLSEAGENSQPAVDAAQAKLTTLHRAFVGRLRADLTAAQVEAVKDGMTYGVVPITYAAYRNLLPDMSPELQRMIMANLVEAREYAMDAGSSHKKHAWFGKYKGRINNQLSAAGYDLKQAERDLAERQRAQ